MCQIFFIFFVTNLGVNDIDSECHYPSHERNVVPRATMQKRDWHTVHIIELAATASLLLAPKFNPHGQGCLGIYLAYTKAGAFLVTLASRSADRALHWPRHMIDLAHCGTSSTPTFMTK